MPKYHRMFDQRFVFFPLPFHFSFFFGCNGVIKVNLDLLHYFLLRLVEGKWGFGMGADKKEERLEECDSRWRWNLRLSLS